MRDHPGPERHEASEGEQGHGRQDDQRRPHLEDLELADACQTSFLAGRRGANTAAMLCQKADPAQLP
jgi:hypothetical protein